MRNTISELQRKVDVLNAEHRRPPGQDGSGVCPGGPQRYGLERHRLVTRYFARPLMLALVLFFLWIWLSLSFDNIQGDWYVCCF